jgi:hypothetical protein
MTANTVRILYSCTRHAIIAMNSGFFWLTFSFILRYLNFVIECFVLQFAVKKSEDKDIQNYNFACCFVWV